MAAADESHRSERTAPDDSEHCPHCDYALEGLRIGAMKCPECGGSLSARAYAMCAARRMRGSLAARMALLVSPVVGIVGGFGVFLIRRGFYDWLGFLFLCLWAGGTTAVYFARERRRRTLGRAVLVGLPVGIAYFGAVIGIAGVIVLVVKWVT